MLIIKMNKKRTVFFGLAVILVAFLFLFTATFIRGQEGSRILILWPNPDINRPVLQLQTFPYITFPPFISNIPSGSSSAMTPGSTAPGMNNPNTSDYCPLDSIKQPGSTCKCADMDGIVCPVPQGESTNCTRFSMPDYAYSVIGLESGLYCAYYSMSGAPMTPPAGCSAACVAKPVVYLYPTKPSSISLKVEAPGTVVASDPNYPPGGWNNIFAHPDGTLLYNGKKYNELFYETSITKTINMPEDGIIIPMRELKNTLKQATAKLGLIPKEQEEFLAYWIPVLENLHSPYIFFSVLTPEVKESVDHLVISPEPDTRIEIIAYFKPLQEPVSIRPLHLPVVPPVRSGFTEVEWGGTLAK